MRIVTMKNDRLIEELKNTLILQNLNVAELRRFASSCELREYEAGELLVEQDSLGCHLHILLDGSVDIILRGKERERVAVSQIRKGDVFGEASIFMDVPRTASAVAKTACLVAAITRESLFAYCDSNPRAGLKLFGFVIYSLLRRLGSTSQDLALEREASVTPEDLENLQRYLPKSLEDLLGGDS